MAGVQLDPPPLSTPLMAPSDTSSSTILLAMLLLLEAPSSSSLFNRLGMLTGVEAPLRAPLICNVLREGESSPSEYSRLYRSGFKYHQVVFTVGNNNPSLHNDGGKHDFATIIIQPCDDTYIWSGVPLYCLVLQAGGAL